MARRDAHDPHQSTLDGIPAPAPAGVSVAESRAEIARVSQALLQEQATVELLREELQEALSTLEQALYEPGWQHLVQSINQQFSRAGLIRIAEVCRVMAVAHPLIRRGNQLRTMYVWGQGVQISARANTPQEGQDVNAVIQEFLDDPLNRAAFTGQQAAEGKERALGTDGNVFLALFTRPRSGRVQIRTIPSDQITQVITNPEDQEERWYYRREWTQVSPDLTTRVRVDYYPDIHYRPASRPGRIGEYPVHWDSPVKHVAVNKPDTWDFGIPDVYPALDWARAYKEFLTDWARLVKALSRFAWRLTARGTKQAKAAARMARAPSTDFTGDHDAAGATAIVAPDMTLEAIPKTGATIDAESGRPLAMMIAAALDVPITMLLGDPGQTGARATAETLDKPTELAMKSRQSLWTDVYEDILRYVIRESVRAPQGALKGTVTRDPETGRETVQLDQDTSTTVDIVWPGISKTDPTQLVAAIVQADQTGYIPELVVLRLLLQALGVTDADEIIEQLTDENGNFKAPAAAAGQAAIDAFRRGEDPAALLDDPAEDNPADGE